MQVVPQPLLQQTRDVLRSRFSTVIRKPVLTLVFDRSSEVASDAAHAEVRCAMAREAHRGCTLNACYSGCHRDQILHAKLVKARRKRAIVVSSPESVKSVLLKYIDLLLQERELGDDIANIRAAAAAATGGDHASADTDEAPVPAAVRKLRLVPELTKQTRACAEHADALRDVIQLWGAGDDGVLLLDEVDMLLHPLKSELNFPIGASLCRAISHPRKWR